MIILEKTIEGSYTARIKNKYLHSKYNPVKESRVLIDKYQYLINSSLIVIYGVGLGYHIEEIINRNAKSTIYVFDGNIELVNMCRRVKPNLFINPNINIITTNNIKFYEIFSRVLAYAGDIIVHKPSLETIKESNYELYKLINNYIFSKQAVDSSGLLKKNYIENLKVNYNNIKFLIEKFLHTEKPFVIVAAGPSVDDELENLKENRERFIVVSVGAALRTLKNNNITPDIIVIIDGSPLIENQLKGFENEKIPLCFLSTASRWAVKNYNGPKYMFFNSRDEDKVVIETGKTVAVAAMSIAIHCGAKEIVLLGQDLAYLNGKSHTSTYESIYGRKDNPTINKYNKRVKGIDGSMLETTSGYIFFKQQIERLIGINKWVKFINCSKGAFIKGAEHIKFQDYINNKLDY